MVEWKQHVDNERGNRAHGRQPAPTCPHCSACQCRPPRLTTGGAHHDDGLPDGCTKQCTAVRKRQRATWHQLSAIGTKREHQRKQQSHLIQSPWNRRYRGNNQCSVSSGICHIRVDQSGPDDLWHSLEVTTGGVADQLLWDDFKRSFRTKILPVQSQNSSDIPAQFLSRKSVKKKIPPLLTGSRVCFKHI